MIRPLATLVLTLLGFFHASGQWNKDSLRNNIWFSGAFNSPLNSIKRINFTNANSSSLPTVDTVQQSLSLATNLAIICDTAGHLIFYTNGGYIYDSTLHLMQNGDSLSPEFGGQIGYPSGVGILDQGSIILPYPGSSSKYSIFHLSNDGIQNNNIGFNQFGKYLYYSIVDMNLNNGKGAVISKSNSLINLSVDSLAKGHINACRHANGIDWWILVKDLAGNTFYRFLLDSNGVHSLGTQSIGQPTIYGSFIKSEFSPNGEYYASYTMRDWAFPVDSEAYISIYNFDRCTGLLYSPNQFNASFSYPDQFYFNQGMSFSPNSKYLYFSNIDSIFQYDIATNTQVLVSVFDTSSIPPPVILDPSQYKFYSMRLAQDNRIYISSFYNTHHYIQFPDSQGVACDVHQNSIVYMPYATHFLILNYPYFTTPPIPGSPCDSSAWPDMIPDVKEEEDIRVFPNPCHSYLQIICSKNVRNEQKLLFDCTGHLVWRGKEDWIDVSGLHSGVYYLRCKSKGIKVIVD